MDKGHVEHTSGSNKRRSSTQAESTRALKPESKNIIFYSSWEQEYILSGQSHARRKRKLETTKTYAMANSDRGEAYENGTICYCPEWTLIWLIPTALEVAIC